MIDFEKINFVKWQFLLLIYDFIKKLVKAIKNEKEVAIIRCFIITVIAIN